MKRQMILIAAIAAAGVLVTSCQRENPNANESGSPIEFRTLMDKTDNSRASLITATPQLTSFFVAAGLDIGIPPMSPQHQAEDLNFMQNAVWKTGDPQAAAYTWNYALKKYFPADGRYVQFYAYSPVKDINMKPAGIAEFDDLYLDGSGNACFEYIVPADQSVNNTAVDLLVAQAEGNSALGITPVTFNFEHALSAVTFSAWNKNPEDSELVYVIHSIGITHLDNEGTYNYTSGWSSNGSNNLTYKAGVPESGVSVMPKGNAASDGYVTLLSDNDYIMVLPQQVFGGDVNNGIQATETEPSSSYVKINLSLKDGSGSFVYKDAYLYLPLQSFPKFEMGKKYDFQFNFSVLEPITFKVTVSEWGIGSTPVPLN